MGCPKSELHTKFVACRDRRNHKDSLIHPSRLNFKPRRVYIGSHLLKQYILSTRKQKERLKNRHNYHSYSVKTAFSCRWKEKPKPGFRGGLWLGAGWPRGPFENWLYPTLAVFNLVTNAVRKVSSETFIEIIL